MTSVNKMSQDQAKVELMKKKLVYNQTVTLTASTALNLSARAIAVEKIDPGTPVDLVTDSSGQVLFQIPATAAPEKANVEAMRKEMDGKIAALVQKNSDDLKAMNAANQKKLDALNQAIKDLKSKIPQ